MIALVIGSALTQVTDEEKQARAALFVMPESEKDPAQMKSTLRWTKASILIGVVVFAMLMILWVVPYLNAAV